MTTNPINMTTQDYYNLSGYLTGATVNHCGNDNELAYGLAGVGVIGVGGLTYKGGKWLWNNRADYKNGWSILKNQNAADKATIQSLKDGNIFKTTRNHYNYNQLMELEKKLKPLKTPTNLSALSDTKKALFEKAKFKSSMYDNVRTMIADAKNLRGKELAVKLKEINNELAKVKYDMHIQTLSGTPELQAVTKRGKALSKIKKYSGYNKLSTGAKSLATKSKWARNVGKLGKGGGAMAVISFACEAPELYETYKTLGASKGTKQLGKTAVVVGAEIAGYAAGAAAGAGVGAAAGAAVGTAICPVVGTAVGALIGVACGVIGSWIAGKGAKAIVGKSELAKAKEAEAQRIAIEAKKDPEAKRQMLIAVGERLAEAEDGNEEAQRARKSYDRINKAEKEIKKKNIAEDTEINKLLEQLNALSNWKIDMTPSLNIFSGLDMFNAPNMFGFFNPNSSFQQPNMMFNS